MDPHSAADADTLIAYALLRYAGADQAALHRDGRRVADAVLSQESVTPARWRSAASSPVRGRRRP